MRAFSACACWGYEGPFSVHAGIVRGVFGHVHAVAMRAFKPQVRAVQGSPSDATAQRRIQRSTLALYNVTPIMYSLMHHCCTIVACWKSVLRGSMSRRPCCPHKSLHPQPILFALFPVLKRLVPEPYVLHAHAFVAAGRYSWAYACWADERLSCVCMRGH